MLAVALSTGVSFYLCMTFGLFISKAARLPANFAEKALIGLVAANTLTTIISLFFPLTGVTVTTLLLCSLIPCYAVRDDFKELFSVLIARKNVLLWSFPFILTACIVSLGPPRAYDTGLYHLQSIQWIEKYAVVPGLANLHGRFGFNPNIFTFYAATSLADFFKQEIFSVNLTIYTILVLHFVHRIHSLFKQEGISNILVFNLIILIDIIFTLSDMSSPSPNFITAVLPYFILAGTVASPDRNTATGFKRYVPIAVLCVYVLTVKLATIPLMLLLFLIVIKHTADRRTIWWLLAGLTVIILPWLARTVIVSGWLIYPFPSLDVFNFDWKVPLTLVIEEKMHITGWARNPGTLHMAAAQMSFFEWFPVWWHRTLLEHKILFSAAFISPLVAFLRVKFSNGKADYHACVVTVTALSGVIFWLLLAPAITFGIPFLVVSTISPLLFWEFSVLRNRSAANRLIIALYVIVLLFLVLQARKYTRFDFGQIAVKPHVINVPQEVDFRYYDLGGTKIFVPTSGDRCYNHVIPCTPYPEGVVTLRGSTLQSGFRYNKQP